MQLISLNKITQGKHGAYNAVDIGRYDSTNKNTDTDWYAPEDCTVTEIHAVDDNTCGKYIRLKGGTGVHTVCHNEKFYVKVGQTLKRGQKVAKMGYTGLTDPDNVVAGTHAHWILNIGGVWVYPITKVNQTFIRLGDNMAYKPTKADMDKAWAELLHEKPSAKNYASYMAKDISWMWHDIAYNLRKRLDIASSIVTREAVIKYIDENLK